MNKRGHKSFLAARLDRLSAVLDREDLVEVAVNADGRVWIEARGMAYMEPEGLELRPDDVANLAQSVASAVGVPLSGKKPLVSGKIEYAQTPLRAQVIVAPAIERGAAVTLRRYVSERVSLDDFGLLHGGLTNLEEQRRQKAKAIRDLINAGRIKEAMAGAIRDQLNIVISGGTSSGKTTFARCLLDLVDPRERIVTIEDAFELFPTQENTVCLKADRSGEGQRTPARLLEATLRMRPDRIILGELRGEETKTFLDAINTGHGGSITTVHADTADRALDRMALMMLSLGLNMSFEEIRRYCALSIDLIVQLQRVEGERGLAEVLLPGMEQKPAINRGGGMNVL